MGPVVDSAADGCGAYGGCADAPTHIGSAMMDTTMISACVVDAANAATATATASR